MAANPLESQIIELKDMISLLKKSMETLQQSLDAALAREEEHIQREQILQEQVAYLTDKLYGRSSEKRGMEGQIGLFDEAESEAAEEPEESTEEDTETVTYTRKKKTTQQDKFSGLPVKKELIDVPEEERYCRE